MFVIFEMLSYKGSTEVALMLASFSECDIGTYCTDGKVT